MANFHTSSAEYSHALLKLIRPLNPTRTVSVWAMAVFFLNREQKRTEDVFANLCEVRALC